MTSGCTRPSNGSSADWTGKHLLPRGPRRARGDWIRCYGSNLVGFPARLGLGAGLFEMDVLVHVVDPGKWNEVMLTPGIGVVLRQFKLISTFQAVHGADM